jgi:hypothetical protein
MDNATAGSHAKKAKHSKTRLPLSRLSLFPLLNKALKCNQQWLNL